MNDRIKELLSRPLPNERQPNGAGRDRQRLNNPHFAYHEAGHAVVFWHHGIRFRYVTMRPRALGHGGHVYVGKFLKFRDAAGWRVAMQLAAAGEIGAGRISRPRDVPDDLSLLNRFTRAAENPEDPWLVEDMRHFISAAKKMDAALLAADSDAVVGPVAWRNVWRDTETLVRDELWPAVYALAWELVYNRHRFTYDEVGAIATTALAVLVP